MAGTLRTQLTLGRNFPTSSCDLNHSTVPAVPFFAGQDGCRSRTSSSGRGPLAVLISTRFM